MAAFLSLILVMWTVYALFSVFPFGENSLLVLDLNGQYVYYFERMRDAILGGDGLLYSWTRALGGEMLGLYAYYLASPFSFLTLLFPDTMITEAILAMTLLKIGSCGLTMAIYLNYQKRSSRISTLIFFLLCTLPWPMWWRRPITSCGWMVLIALPLIIWGIERLVDKRKFALFIIPWPFASWPTTISAHGGNFLLSLFPFTTTSAGRKWAPSADSFGNSAGSCFALPSR